MKGYTDPTLDRRRMIERNALADMELVLCGVLAWLLDRADIGDQLPRVTGTHLGGPNGSDAATTIAANKSG